jgi:type I restriction enzyme S subunit
MIPIPPIEVQKQIVKQISELRICSVELIESIEKEIKLRQNQYEYYRDKILAFQEAN